MTQQAKGSAPPEGSSSEPSGEDARKGETALLRALPAAPLGTRPSRGTSASPRSSSASWGVLTVAAVAAFFIAETRMQAAVLGQMESDAVLFSEASAGATRRAMLENRRKDAYDIMRDIGRQEGVERVRMLNKEGTVTFSTDASEIGKQVQKGAESCVACHVGRSRCPGCRSRCAPASSRRTATA